MRVCVSVVSADVAGFLRTAALHGVKLSKVSQQGDLCIDFWINASELNIIEEITCKRGDSCTVVGKTGSRLRVQQLANRWLLILTSLLLIWLSVWLPSKVLFVSVEGNSSVSEQKILLAAEECGVGFGKNRGDIRSAKLKNYMLEKIPEIGWVCVNTCGCTAKITVIEQTDSQSDSIESGKKIGIYAAVDGLVISKTVREGFSAVSVGQAVKAGQLLVGGSQHDGVFERYIRPNAEIFALTNRTIIASNTQNHFAFKRADRNMTKYYLLIGKKRINLLKDSRIYPTMYDKIQRDIYLTLPGGFALPLGIGIEYIYDIRVADPDLDESADFDVQGLIDDYVRSRMISGKILDRQVDFDKDNHLVVRYHCIEMIGREQSEEFDASYGKNN